MAPRHSHARHSFPGSRISPSPQCSQNTVPGRSEDQAKKRIRRRVSCENDKNQTYLSYLRSKVSMERWSEETHTAEKHMYTFVCV